MDERDLLHRATLWVRSDPDSATRAEVSDAISREDGEWLADHFQHPLTFGTAGLRGRLGPGAARMNQAQACLLATGLADDLDIFGVAGPVVVAHDARRESPGFARDIVAVLRAHGRDVIYCQGPVATPVASWIARTHEAPAAVIVTPSHNPIGDAGLKVCGPEGAQIIPPRDARIRAAMDASVGRRELANHRRPRDLVAAPPSSRQGGLVVIENAHRDYEETVLLQQSAVRRGLTIVTSALHGVAGASVVRLLEGTGHQVHPVESQQEPDGTFPTLTNPNPEDPIALELLITEARARDADLALANDPDGDRLAVAVPDGDGWRILTGNEVGVLLADHLLEPSGQALLVTTVVSTPLVEELARSRSARLVKTWTGFKWIAAAIAWAERAAAGVPTLGFEEAQGYCVGDLVRDKDGLLAAVAVADMVTALREQDLAPLDRLGQLQDRFGVWVSDSIAFPVAAGDGDELVGRLVAAPPTALDNRVVETVIDHREPTDDPLLFEQLPPASIVELRGDGLRVLVRPSGTEPTVKVYVHLHAPADGDPHGVADALAGRARRTLEEVCGLLGLI